jgi:hypothetical protein
MTAGVRYVGTLEDIIDQVQADFDRMGTEAFDVTFGGSSIVFGGCNLVPGSVMTTLPPVPQDNGNLCTEITFQLTEDQPTS